MRLIKYSNRNDLPATRFSGRFGTQDIENEIDWLFGTAFSGFAPSVLGGQFPVSNTGNRVRKA